MKPTTKNKTNPTLSQNLPKRIKTIKASKSILLYCDQSQTKDLYCKNKMNCHDIRRWAKNNETWPSVTSIFTTHALSRCIIYVNLYRSHSLSRQYNHKPFAELKKKSEHMLSNKKTKHWKKSMWDHLILLNRLPMHEYLYQTLFEETVNV